MDLSKRQWYVAWFFLSLAIIDEFMDERGWRQSRYSEGTNLCSFVRVILLWAPIIVVLNLLGYAAVIAVLTYLPIHLFGLTGYGWIVGGLAAVVAVIWLINVTFAALGRSNARRRELRRRENLHRGFDEREAPEPEKKGPSFAAVLWGYVVAAKQRICPMINFQ